MRTVKITSDGTIKGTTVFDAQTMQEIAGVTDLRFVASIRDRSVCEAQVTILVPDLEITVPAIVQDLFDEIEQGYDFQSTGGPLANCSAWRKLKAIVRHKIKEGEKKIV